MNHIDIKVTAWNRIHYTDKADMQTLIERVKKGEDESIWDNDEWFDEFETVYDTEENISIEENQGYSTIEVYENDKLIWQNGIQ